MRQGKQIHHPEKHQHDARPGNERQPDITEKNRQEAKMNITTENQERDILHKLITETSELIGTNKNTELNTKLEELMKIPFSPLEYELPEAAKAADNLLHLYTALRAMLVKMGYDEKLDNYAEQVFLVASKMLVVALAGFKSERYKPYQRSEIVQ